MKINCIRDNASIREAIQQIDASGMGLTVVVSPDERVEGVISDGDIRRALLKGATLDQSLSAFISKRFYSVTPAATRADVLDLIQAIGIRQIPIIDENRKLHGIHTLETILGKETRPNWAIIMAGGKGTRLRPITENIPKPMVKVAGRPILERIVLHLVSYGIRQVFLSINYLGHIIEEHFGDGRTFGCHIDYLREKEPLGTGGALSLLPEKSNDPVLVMNGDLVIQADLNRMLRFHESKSYYATMGIRPYTHEVPFGCVELSGEQIIGLQEKPLLQKMINAGVYVLSPEAVSEVPHNTFYPITTIFENAIKEEKICGSWVIDSEWMDIGIPKQLQKANGIA